MLKKETKRLIIFGTGRGGENIFQKENHANKVLAFVDNSSAKQGTHYLGKCVIAPNEISNLVFDEVIIASQYFDEICTQLVELKIPPEKITLVPKDELMGASLSRSYFKKLLLRIFLKLADIWSYLYIKLKSPNL